MRTFTMRPFCLALAPAMLLVGFAVHAQSSPSQSESSEALEADRGVQTLSSTKAARYTRRLDGEWKDFLLAAELRIGANEGDLFVSSGSAAVGFAAEHSGFIEARGLAYEIAYLRAKAELIRFLGTSGSREQVIERLESASWARGQPTDPVEPLRQGARIERKLADLAEAGLDHALGELEPDYDPNQYESRAQKEEAFRLGFQSKIFTTAAAFVAGAMPLQVLEGPSADGNSYQILVGLVWTPKLSRLAGAVGDSARPMSAHEAGERIEDSLPATVDEVVASWGIHHLVNENGEQVLVSFGQAAPRTASPTRRERANDTALEVAAMRAEGAIRAFVGETLESRRTEDTSLALVEYATAAEGAEIDRAFYERIRAVTGEVDLRGLATVGEWVVDHPANGQSVAVAAVSWSPGGVAFADRVREAMETRQEQPVPVADQPDSGAKADGEGRILSKQNVKLKQIR